MSVPSGYKIGRDKKGVTERERRVLELFLKGDTYLVIAEDLGVTKQRVMQMVKSLVKKGALVRSPEGRYGRPIER